METETISRFGFFAGAAAATVVCTGLVFVSPYAAIPAAMAAALTLLGVWDVTQKRHSILRNYPVIGHMRWMFEGIRPEIRQYLIESENDEVPFSREQRSIVYQRAKNQVDKRPFGTRHDVYEAGFAWFTHSINSKWASDGDFRVNIGGQACSRPYDASIFNISAMSYGSLSPNAILALNTGAKRGNFAHDTGEGGISRYHREPGGDLIWEIGSGYFGCRDEKGHFDLERFKENAAADQVKMVEVKLSQGAKPGHGGILPAAKITPEIAAARGIPMGRDCVSPPSHSAFDTPIAFMHFLQTLREGSGGKPVGFKLCVGHRWEVMAMAKAMLETGIVPDFIVVDGKEGGTGAAPLEFVNHIGMPMAEGLTFLRNVLVGAGLRSRIKIGAAGKRVTAFDLVYAHALGADWSNSARGYMFAVGCVQAQACHTNRCPTGVTTTDPLRQRALVVSDKSERVYNYHRNTLKALAELVAAAGFDHPSEIKPSHVMVRQKSGEVLPADEAFPALEEGELLHGDGPHREYAALWANAQAESFDPVVPQASNAGRGGPG